MSKIVTTPNLPEPFDWNANFKWISTIVGALVAYTIYLMQYFKYRAKNNEEFIIKVVETTVKATLTSELSGIKDDIKVLFKYRDDDRTHADNQFKELLREIKK